MKNRENESVPVAGAACRNASSECVDTRASHRVASRRVAMRRGEPLIFSNDASTPHRSPTHSHRHDSSRQSGVGGFRADYRSSDAPPRGPFSSSSKPPLPQREREPRFALESHNPLELASRLHKWNSRTLAKVTEAGDDPGLLLTSDIRHLVIACGISTLIAM